MINKNINVAFCVMLIGLALLCSVRTLADAPEAPTPEELLSSMGYNGTTESLTQAFASGDAWAQIYSLMYLQAQNDPSFLKQARALLVSPSIKVQLESAKLLAQFNVDSGIKWLQKWEVEYFDLTSPIVDTVHAVLDAASSLALRGDERLAKLIGPLLTHKYWAVRIHAARALGDFRETENPTLEAIWLSSADVAIEALGDGSREDFVELYMTWLVSSLFQQTNITPKMIGRFAELAKNQHPVICRTIGVRLNPTTDSHNPNDHDHGDGSSHDHDH